MKYAVITACLNSSSTLSRTIKSIFKQTVLPHEYIFVDGGSSDGTLNIINDAIARANRNSIPTTFKVINQKTDGGIYEAWNLALREVSSDLICILSSDDWYNEDTMSYVIDKFNQEDKGDILLGSGLYVNTGSGNNRTVRHTRPFFMLPFAMTAIHPACFVKRSVYERIGYFDASYKVSGDYEFIYRCRKAGVKFIITRKILVNVQNGGFAESHWDLGALESRHIASKYCAISILPKIAYLLRVRCLSFLPLFRRF